jgi:integrase/recombinase XerC
MSTDLVVVETHPVPASNPVPSLIDAWLAGKKPTTVRGYSEDLSAFARWLGASSPGVAVDDLLALPAGEANGLVLRWSTWMLDHDLSSATINRRLAALRSVTKLARMLGRIAWAIEVEGPKHEPRRDVKGPGAAGMKRTAKTLKKLGSGRQARRDRAIVSLLFGLGLRRAEVIGLDLEDLDWDAKRVSVLRKGKREKTSMSLPAEVEKSLSDWVVTRGSHPGPLFFRVQGNRGHLRLHPYTVNRVVEAVGKAAELPRKLRPHGLRHEAATELARRGKTVLQIRDFTGHAKLETVMRYLDESGAHAGEMAAELSKTLG